MTAAGSGGHSPPTRSARLAPARATAFAPASVANVAVGFDLLGFSADVAGDTVTVEKIDRVISAVGDRGVGNGAVGGAQTSAQTPGGSLPVTIEMISGTTTSIPLDAAKNTATAGLLRLIEDRKLPYGFRVTIEKGIPLGSGMGGSAASAVAALVAANALLDHALSEAELLSYALIGEAQASGSFHADNLAPSLRGGLTLARVSEAPLLALPQLAEVEIISIPIPAGVHCVLVHPHLAIETKQARGILKPHLSLHDHIAQSAAMAGFIAGCFYSDVELIRRSFHDLIIEPQRAHLIPGFYDVKRSALTEGALGCSISGAGPSVFAWTATAAQAHRVQAVMTQAFAQSGVRSDAWSFPLSASGTGARVIAKTQAQDDGAR